MTTLRPSRYHRVSLSAVRPVCYTTECRPDGLYLLHSALGACVLKYNLNLLLLTYVYLLHVYICSLPGFIKAFISLYMLINYNPSKFKAIYVTV